MVLASKIHFHTLLLVGVIQANATVMNNLLDLNIHANGSHFVVMKISTSPFFSEAPLFKHFKMLKIRFTPT